MGCQHYTFCFGMPSAPRFRSQVLTVLTKCGPGFWTSACGSTSTQFSSKPHHKHVFLIHRDFKFCCCMHEHNFTMDGSAGHQCGLQASNVLLRCFPHRIVLVDRPVPAQCPTRVIKLDSRLSRLPSKSNVACRTILPPQIPTPINLCCQDIKVKDHLACSFAVCGSQVIWIMLSSPSLSAAESLLRYWQRTGILLCINEFSINQKSTGMTSNFLLI